MRTRCHVHRRRGRRRRRQRHRRREEARRGLPGRHLRRRRRPLRSSSRRTSTSACSASCAWTRRPTARCGCSSSTTRAPCCNLRERCSSDEPGYRSGAPAPTRPERLLRMPELPEAERARRPSSAARCPAHRRRRRRRQLRVPAACARRDRRRARRPRADRRAPPRQGDVGRDLGRRAGARAAPRHGRAHRRRRGARPPADGTASSCDFDDGGRLALRDKRRLGRAVLEPDFAAVGPDAAEVEPGRVPRARRPRDRAAQGAADRPGRRSSGVGNLLADEILWRARLAPRRAGGRAEPPRSSTACAASARRHARRSAAAAPTPGRHRFAPARRPLPALRRRCRAPPSAGARPTGARRNSADDPVVRAAVPASEKSTRVGF